MPMVYLSPNAITVQNLLIEYVAKLIDKEILNMYMNRLLHMKCIVDVRMDECKYTYSIQIKDSKQN